MCRKSDTGFVYLLQKKLLLAFRYLKYYFMFSYSLSSNLFYNRNVVAQCMTILLKNSRISQFIVFGYDDSRGS